MKHQFLFRVLVTHYVSKSGVSFVQDIKPGEKSGLECEFHLLRTSLWEKANDYAG